MSKTNAVLKNMNIMWYLVPEESTCAIYTLTCVNFDLHVSFYETSAAKITRSELIFNDRMLMRGFIFPYCLGVEARLLVTKF